MSKNNKYINSGILEAYCLQLTSRLECKKVKKVRSKNRFVKEELIEIQKSFEKFKIAYPLMPSKSLKSKILQAIEQLG